jgi:hypothetical protein
LSRGKRISINSESSSRPKNVKVVVGKTVLSALIGKPICFDNVKIFSNVCRQRSKCTVKYQTIEDAVKLMKFYGKGCLLSKADIENSFKIIPIHPDDHELLGFPLGDQYFFYKTLPMGLSFSCKLFETFSTAVHWIIDHKLGGSGCEMIQLILQCV